MQLVIRSGLVVATDSVQRTDVGIDDGRIVQLGGQMSGADEIDAAGRFVLPGGVDPHVHLTPPTERAGEISWVDDFESGSRAALAGGITTVGNVTFPDRDSNMVDALARDRALAARQSLADYFLHPVLRDANEANLGQIDDLMRTGHPSLKLFLSFRRFDRNVDAHVEAMVRCGRAGGLAMLHCEDAAVIDCCGRLLHEAGRTDPRYFPESRPVQSEAIATARAVAFAEATGCPVYIVHLAAEEALDAARRGRQKGLPVYVETRPLYLHLTAARYDEPDGAKYAGAPPLRSQRDRDALWAGLRFGDVDVVATDHAPWMLADKTADDRDATNLPHGVADLETSLPMLWSEGVGRGRLSMQRFVALTATNPARLFGLAPRKGVIAVGSDADVVVWDPTAERVVDGRTMHSRADYSPYDGWKVKGWPAVTISRGEVVALGPEIVGSPGRGEEILRSPFEPL